MQIYGSRLLLGAASKVFAHIFAPKADYYRAQAKADADAFHPDPPYEYGSIEVGK